MSGSAGVLVDEQVSWCAVYCTLACFTFIGQTTAVSCVCRQGEFREQNFNTAMGVLKDVGDAGKGDQKGRKGGMKGQTLD